MRRLATAGFLTLLGAAALAVTGALRTKGLAVTLGPAGLGSYGQAWALAQYAGAVGGLGVGLAATKMVAERAERQDGAGVLRVVPLTFWLPLFGGVILLLAAVALAGPISRALFGRIDLWLVLVASLSIPFVALQAPKQHVLQGLEDARGQAAVSAAYGAIFTVAAVVGALVAGAQGAVVGLLVGNVAFVGLYLGRERVLLRPYRLGEAVKTRVRTLPRLRGPEASELLRLGFLSTLVLAMTAVADIFVRSLIQGGFGDVAAGHWFALFLLSSQFIGVVTGSLSYFTAPMIARTREAGDRAMTSRVLNDSLRLTFVLMFPLLVAMALAREPLIDILFSPSFAPIVPDLPIMLAADALRLVAWTLGVALVPLGLSRAWVSIAFAGLLGFAGVAWLTVEQLGATAGAVGWVVLWGVSAVATAAVLAIRRAWVPSVRSALSFAAGACALATASLVSPLLATAPATLLCAAMIWVGTTASERAAALSFLRFRRRSRRP